MTLYTAMQRSYVLADKDKANIDLQVYRFSFKMLSP